jgi:hypothetical protein
MGWRYLNAEDAEGFKARKTEEEWLEEGCGTVVSSRSRPALSLSLSLS